VLSYNQDADHKIDLRCRILIRVLSLQCLTLLAVLYVGVVWILCTWVRTRKRERSGQNTNVCWKRMAGMFLWRALEDFLRKYRHLVNACANI